MNFLKIFKIFLFLVSLCDAIINHFEQDSQYYSTIAAFKDFVGKFYIDQNTRLGIVVINTIPKIFNQLFLQIQELFPLKLAIIKTKYIFHTRYSHSAIVLTTSCEDYGSIHKIFFLSSLYPVSFKFLVYVQNCPIEYLKNNIQIFLHTQKLSYEPGRIEHFEFLLIDDGGFL